MKDNIKKTVEDLGLNEKVKVVNYLNVWSNGNKVRRYVGQGKGSEWHSPEKGYKRMVAILVDIDDLKDD